MKLVQQLPLMVALSLCATHAFADGDSTADITFKGSIKVPPCTINQVPNVNLGTDIEMTKFKGAGSQSDPVPFQVSMTCPAGIKALSYKLTPAGGSQPVSDGKDGEMTLSGSSTASGVAVKIMDGDGSNHDPIPLGQNNPVGDRYDPSKFDQTVKLNYLADYVQTADNVKGGEADAQAQFTLSYE